MQSRMERTGSLDSGDQSRVPRRPSWGGARIVAWLAAAALCLAGCAAGATPAPATTPQPTPIPGQQLLRKDAAGAFLAAAESYATQQGLLTAQFKGTTALAGLQVFSTKLAESVHNFNEHLRLIRFPEDAKAAAGDLMAAGSAAEANYRQCSTATTVDACSGFLSEAEKNLAAGRDAANLLRSKLGITLVS